MRLKDLVTLITKGSSPSWQGVKYVDKGILFITSENVREGFLELSSPKYLEDKFNNLQSRSILKKGDLLTNIVGASIGRTAEFNLNLDNCNINQAVAIIRLLDKSLNSYFLKVLNSTFIIVQMFGKTVETARPNISLSSVENLIVPLPPLAEQHRIVAKIEELLPKVEEYGKAQDALNKLNEELPERLKKSILQEAIEGRLVPQDPTDEPASVLLAKIRKEKEQLVKEGKLKKKDLNETHISEDEIPFEIPDSWKWVRLGDVTEIARGGSPRPIKEYLTDAPNGLNWIKIGDTDKGGKYINSCKEKIKPEGLKKTRMVHPGDFLLTNSMSFGRPYITNIEGCIHDGWLMISPYAGVFDQSFLFYVLSSAFAHKQFSDKVAGAVVQNLNSDKVADSYVPIPPLAEQHRIVEKLEQVLGEIDKLMK